MIIDDLNNNKKFIIKNRKLEIYFIYIMNEK